MSFDGWMRLLLGHKSLTMVRVVERCKESGSGDEGGEDWVDDEE